MTRGEVALSTISWNVLSIPLVAGLVGWFTNWLAIWMTFHPLRFIGIPPWLGWQGIIPRKAEKMARNFVDTSMARLGTATELFEGMEPNVMARHVEAVLEPRIEHYTDDVLLASSGELWEQAPTWVRKRVYRAVREQLPVLVRTTLADISARLDELLDFRHMVVSRLVEDRILLNRLFLESGSEEFRFLVRSGLYFGFLFGLLELFVWWLWPNPLQLPVFGALVGYATNWLALNLIFRPLYPIQLGPWTLQGLFLRRQKEVAAVWCRLVTREILTVRRFMQSMITGPRGERARQTILEHVRPLVDRALASIGPLAQLVLEPKTLERIAENFGRKAIEVSGDPFEDERFNEDRSRVIEAMLRERMENLSPEEFQNLLRPCFQEDEMTLILLGAALGGLAGWVQMLWF
jgi:uncharacterized membrane protein YheB (UPF0754 family)